MTAEAHDPDGRVESPAPPERWVALVRGDDRPGTLTALTSVFSTRGVSFDSLATGLFDGDAVIAVTFTATLRRKHLLVRTVARLSSVRSVEVRSAQDPAVRAAGVVRIPDGAAFSPPTDLAVRWSGDAAVGQPVLIEGTLADVTALMDRAHGHGAAMTAVVILGF